MGRNRYKLVEGRNTYFLTSSVVNWLPLFATPGLAEIVIDSLNFLHQKQRIKIHAWVLMETHFHLVATSFDISSEMRKMKSYTARSILKYLKDRESDHFLKQLKFYKKKHKRNQDYQVWQEGIHPKLIVDEKTLLSTIEYIHNNPVKRGYVDMPDHWRYSSGRDYAGLKGLVDIEPLV